MPIVSAPADEVSADVVFGFAIKEVGAGQRHCGALYSPNDDEVRFLHLAFHYDLRNELLNATYWWAKSGLQPENQMIMAALACNIAEADPPIPYGFDMQGNIFDPGSGELQPGPPGTGLTCASFVLAMLKTYGFEPIDFSKWSTRDEDAQWQARILAAMQQNGASEQHINAVRDGSVALRFRPEEVVATSSQDADNWPYEQDQAVKLAQEVLDDMGCA